MNRKAQITLFIVIGIVILLSSALFFYMQSLQVGPFKLFKSKTAPVEEFIDRCIMELGKTGIDKLTNQGGYIYFPSDIEYNPTHYIREFPIAESDLVPKIPLWYFDGKLQFPSEQSMQRDLETYVESNIDSCLNNFSSFRAAYVIEQKTSKHVVSSINNKDVAIQLNQVLEITPRGANDTTRRTAFTITLDVPLKKMYLAAKEIAQSTSNTFFFENFTLEMASIMPPEDFPFTDFSILKFQANKPWTVYQVKNNLQNLLVSTYPGIRFVGTDTIPFQEESGVYESYRDRFQDVKTIPADVMFEKNTDTQVKSRSSEKILRSYKGYEKNAPADAYAYFHYQVYFKEPIVDGISDNNALRDYSKMKVGVRYLPEWGMNLQVSPSKNGIMEPSKKDLGLKLLSVLGINFYHFIYTIQYPVEIVIREPTANKGQGQVFKFAMPVMIKYNAPDKRGDAIEYFVPQGESAGFCDDQLRGEKKTRFIAMNSITKEEIKGVNLTFECLQYSCELGTTQSNNAHYQFESTLPNCFGPQVLAQKEGYLEKRLQFYTQDVRIELEPVKNVSVHLFKHQTDEFTKMADGSVSKGIPRWLMAGERALIFIESTSPLPYSTFISFEGTGLPNATASLSLLTRNNVLYTITAYLMNKDGVVIGGYMGNFTPSSEQVLESTALNMHIFEYRPLPSNNDQELMNMFNYINNQSNSKLLKQELTAES